MDSFDDDDLELFETLVAHASASLERARLVEELRYEVDSKSHQATHDMLTGLPNRMLFLTRAAAALSESDGVAIVLLDIDRFKDVNDTLGHAIGDRLLCEIAERLLRAVSAAGHRGPPRRRRVRPRHRRRDRAREGRRPSSTTSTTRSSRPIKMDGLTLAVTASAGIAMAPEHGDDVALLLQRADIAMYLAKERRSTVELYSVEQDQSMRRWLMLGGLLTHALEEESELSLMYQPIADVRPVRSCRSRPSAAGTTRCRERFPRRSSSGSPSRWGSSRRSRTSSLPKAAAKWPSGAMPASTSVSPSTSRDGSSPTSLSSRGLPRSCGNDLPPDILTLEVTETEIMADLVQASKVLDQLSALGIKIGIDDYGTGYSSLAYLHRLPVQELKIDRSFVTNLPNEASNRIIVSSSIAMAHSLGLHVVAEGAEDELTCAILAEAGCDFIQGYYLSSPRRPTVSRRGSWTAHRSSSPPPRRSRAPSVRPSCSCRSPAEGSGGVPRPLSTGSDLRLKPVTR